MGQSSWHDPDPASDEFQALATAVRAYSHLVAQSRVRPVATDPVELLRALSAVGEASVEVVRRAGAL
ncbi:hypothetical protein [Flexivirga caeni]|uniref:Uncharacterized protein n=1 Tax=Flexivirga caeni TaxID=2294115 RepID=A0A3M9M6U0_9MICO|nr:hypothetical protein [Flexivirga caeni]RNI21294.1 hypothetical protein EFY87_11405 [Flexivirga caeni]